jgi:hypothetical protein
MPGPEDSDGPSLDLSADGDPALTRKEVKRIIAQAVEVEALDEASEEAQLVRGFFGTGDSEAERLRAAFFERITNQLKNISLEIHILRDTPHAGYWQVQRRAGKAVLLRVFVREGEDLAAVAVHETAAALSAAAGKPTSHETNQEIEGYFCEWRQTGENFYEFGVRAWEEIKGIRKGKLDLTGSDHDDPAGSFAQYKDFVRRQLILDHCPRQEIADQEIELYGKGKFWMVFRVRGWPYLYKVMRRQSKKGAVVPVRYRYGDRRTNQEFSVYLNREEPLYYPLAALTEDISREGLRAEKQEAGIDFSKVLRRSFGHPDRERKLRQKMIFQGQCEVLERLFARKMFMLDLAFENLFFLEREFNGEVCIVPAVADFDDILEFIDKPAGAFLGESAFFPGKDVLTRLNLTYFIYNSLTPFIYYRKDSEVERQLRHRFIRVSEESNFLLPMLPGLLRNKQWLQLADLLAKLPDFKPGKGIAAELDNYFTLLSAAGLTMDIFTRLKREIIQLSRNSLEVRAKYNQPVYRAGITHRDPEEERKEEI